MAQSVNTEVIIQARMSSTRLPGKILAPLVGECSVLEWVIERARANPRINRVVVATTDTPSDDATEELCTRLSCLCVRGSEDDVLSRFAKAVEAYPAEIIVHWTADNPLVDKAELDRLLDLLDTEHLDYINNHKDGLPLGMGVAAFTSSSFARVIAEAKTPYDREHVTPYYYNHPEFFSVRFIAPVSVHPFAQNVRLTLDSPEDLEALQVLAEGMKFSDPAAQPSTAEILNYLNAHPEIVQINSNITQKTRPYNP